MKKKYEVIGVVGEGAYGIVYKCKNKETGKYVAIKKFKETEDELVKKTMKRELKMLQQLKHENIVDFQESFIHKGNLFLVFEYVEKNLLEVLEESPDGLPPKLIKSFVYQMCKALDYMHKNNMIHRDIKPENLLIDEDLNLKLCDFGFARKVKLNLKNNNITEMTDYVATRWYRSPELLLSGGIYGPDVDYWAVGCIMGELADGNPMFPGENETDQINCIIKVLGNLPNELVNMFYKNPIYEGKKLLEISRPESLERKYMGKLGPTAIDFMKGLLQLDPKKRLNSETVFKHKYFSCFVKDEQNNENKKENNIKENNIADENIKKNKNNSKENITKEKANKEKSNNEVNQKENKELIEKKNNEKIEKKINDANEKYLNKKLENNNIKIENKNEMKNIPLNKPIQTKVINNTTNINIINYNNGINNTNNIIEIHNNNIQDNISSNNSISKSLHAKDSKNVSNQNTNNTNRKILINNNMIINVTNNSNNKKQKIKKIEITNKPNNNHINNMGDSMIYFKNHINMNDSIYNNNQIGNKKSSSQDKNINFVHQKNINLFNNYSNYLAMSLSKEKKNKINKMIHNNSNKIIYNNNLDNISSTFYSIKNNKKKNSVPKNITKYNNSKTEKDLINKNGKTNISLQSNNYLNGYKTFFNKDKINNNKYNYSINTKYFKEEMEKYSHNPSPDPYYNNVIDENEEYIDSNNNINIQSFYIKNSNNYPYTKKKSNFEKKMESRVINKYKDNIISNKLNDKLKYNYNIKKNNGYGTIYNYGGFDNKKKNVELPQLFKLYNNKNDYRNMNNNLYYGYSYKNNYYK